MIHEVKKMMPRVMSVSGGGDVGAREGFCVSCKEMFEPGGLRKPKMLRCYHTFCRYVCSQIVTSLLKINHPLLVCKFFCFYMNVKKFHRLALAIYNYFLKLRRNGPVPSLF